MLAPLPGGTLQLLSALLLYTSLSWIRLLIALALSMLVSLGVGIWAARSDRAGRIILPLTDIFQTLPILAFFPFAIYVIVTYVPSPLGVEAAVIFLMITSMIWNIIFGVYESMKAMPKELFEVSDVYGMSRWQRIRKVYVPAVMPKVVEQANLSWAIGLFYLVTSEIFAVGSTSYSVAGVGTVLAGLAIGGNFYAYAMGLGVFIAFVLATRYILFAWLERRFSMSKQFAPPAHAKRHLTMLGITHKVRLDREIRRLVREGRPSRRAPRRRALAARAPARAAAAPAAAAGRRGSRAYQWLLIAIAVLLAALYAAGAINGTTLGYEAQALDALVQTFARVWFAFIVVLAAAVPLSVYIIFFSRRLNSYITVFQILASIPATIVLPVIVLAVSGFAFSAEIVAFLVFFLSGIWYVIFSVIAEAKAIDPEVLEVKRVFGVRGLRAWKEVYIRVIVPGLITGAVTAVAAEWNASIVAEYFTSTGIGNGAVLSQVGIGIGKLLDTSLASGNLTLMVIALINLTAMILLINTFVWKRLYRRMSEIYS